MTHESPVSPRSVAFKDTETTSRASISFFIYKVLRLRPFGMVGFEPTTQIPLTTELHPHVEMPCGGASLKSTKAFHTKYDTLASVVTTCPPGLVKMKGFEPLTRRLKACCSTS